MTATPLVDACLTTAQMLASTHLPRGSFITAADALGLRFRLLDAALIRGSPFPAAWCSGPPGHHSLEAVDRIHAQLARFAFRILDPRTRQQALASAANVAAQALELNRLLRKGAPLPSAWVAPPQRLHKAATAAGAGIAARTT